MTQSSLKSVGYLRYCTGFSLDWKMGRAKNCVHVAVDCGDGEFPQWLGLRTGRPEESAVALSWRMIRIENRNEICSNLLIGDAVDDLALLLLDLLGDLGALGLAQHHTEDVADTDLRGDEEGSVEGR